MSGAGGDPWAAKLLAEPRCAPAGLVFSAWPLVRFPEGGAALLLAYDRFCRALEAAILACLPKGAGLALIYPPHALHCTVATLLSFIPSPTAAGALPAADREAAAAELLARAQADPEWPAAGPLYLTVGRPTLSGTFVGFFHNEDSPRVAAARACLQRAAADSPFAASIKTPGIVHSTFLRFGAAVDAAAAEGGAERAAAFRAAFEKIAADWTPVRVKVDSFGLFKESIPYMHMPAPAANHVLATVSF
jgi:hypothetical protein